MKKYLDAKSIHIFAYPFTWDEKEHDFKEMAEKRGWRKKEFDFSMLKDEELKDIYMLDKYMSAEAKDIWKNNQGCVVYEFPNIQELRYIIRLSDQKEYALWIDFFELHIYSNNEGVLYINALNMDETTTVEDIKIISNQGRCIALPFLPADENGYIECPEQVGISFKTEEGVKECVKNYRTKVQSIFEHDETLDASVNFLNQIINLDYAISDETDENPKIKVRTIEDHRMFVMSLIADKDLSEKIIGLQQENRELEELWYAILHIDKQSASCQNEEMCRKLLKERTYARWIGYGTIYGATQYSFIGITNPTSRDVVIRPFYREYKYMLSLVLAQKIGIMKFSKAAEMLADELKKKKKEKNFIDSELCLRLVDLQENYIAWKNKMLIPEISNQEQGIELYQLMQEQILVNKKKEKLDEQLREMYEVVTVSNTSRDSKTNLVIALVALIISAVSLVAAFFM